MNHNSLQAIPELWLITTLCFCGILDTSGAVICHGNKAMSPGPFSRDCIATALHHFMRLWKALAASTQVLSIHWCTIRTVHTTQSLGQRSKIKGSIQIQEVHVGLHSNA